MSLATLKSTRVLAVLRAPSAESALRAADALVDGGVTGLEITYSTPDAPAVIRALDEKYGDRIYLGAGTVTTARAGGTGSGCRCPVPRQPRNPPRNSPPR